MSSLATDRLEASYGPAPVLRGVDLQVDPGQIVSLLGPSGCGKSTLLRVLAGFMRPTAGTVSIGDVIVAGPGTHIPPERRRVTVVPQEGALFPHLDVSANIGYGLGRGGASHPRVAELLDLIGMADVPHAFPHHLSGGQQQRVALARALAPRPAVVLLDEPFSALDVTLRHQLRNQVQGLLRHEGASALIVTHDQQEALSMADRVAVMQDGTIHQLDTPTEVYQRPVGRWVAEFVGAAVILAAEPDAGRVRTALGLLPLEGVSRGHVLVRPEQIAITPSGVQATVEAVDFLGHERVIRAFLTDRTEVTVRTSGHTPASAPGDTIRLTVTGSAWGI